ncbi:MAG: glycosyltransferase family 2 protein [Oscillospiraceae bacterium]|nr:glycosyltransferase family 2 protein [Oscillospiraceae bacterium]MDD6146903.1 glycosyltransferase family 2 protein [Oscillospiraceae bacterium]
MPELTVFTPTFNRAHTLPRLYDSLCQQSCKDFCWLIIDDGSTDSTVEYVKELQQKNCGFEIRYIYKENGGLHTAYNTAIENLDTELAMCIDSDDRVANGAIEKILNKWHREGSDTLAGIDSLDCYEDGKIIGDPLPDQKTVNPIDLMVGKYKLRDGDRKLIIRSELYKSVAPMPTLNGEKNFNPHYMHLKISLKYDFLVMNEPTCIVEYQPDGMANNIFRQYRNSPNSFAQLRLLCMDFLNAPLKFQIKNAVHYDSSSILAGKFSNIWKESKKPLLTIAMIFPGILLSILIKVLSKKQLIIMDNKK